MEINTVDPHEFEITITMTNKEAVQIVRALDAFDFYKDKNPSLWDFWDELGKVL